MAISFNSIPANIRINKVATEKSNERALRNVLIKRPFKILLLGHKTTGTASTNEIKRIISYKDAETFFGRNSSISGMARSFRENDEFTELFAIAVDEDSTGVAAEGNITFTGTSTAAGTIEVHVAGYRVTYTAGVSATATQIALGVASAINANLDIPVTALANGAVVELTADETGAHANRHRIVVTNTSLPAGITATVTAFTGGAGAAEVELAIASIPSEQYNIIVSIFNGQTDIDLIDDELEDRDGPIRQIGGMHFVGYTDSSISMSSILALASANNKKLLSIIDTGSSKGAEYEVASAVAAKVAFAAQQDPARPFQTLVINPSRFVPSLQEARSDAQRNTLLYNGVSTIKRANDDLVIERMITTYQLNENAIEDISFLDVTTFFTLDYIRYSVQSMITQKFPRHKLAGDTVRVGPGQAVVTPSIMKAELIALFRQLEEEVIVEDVEQFKKDLIVEINSNDPNRLDIEMSPNIVNQLIFTAVKISFIL